MRGIDGPLDWREFADCAQVDPEMWFPESPSSAERDQALLICEACPVRIECLTESLATGSTEGMWGGFSESDRKRMFRAVAAGERPEAVALREVAANDDTASREAAARAEHRRRMADKKNASAKRRRAEANRESDRCVA